MTNPTQRRRRSRRPRSTGRRHIKKRATRSNSKSSNRSSKRRVRRLKGGNENELSTEQINTLLEDVFDQNILSKIRKDLKELRYDPDFKYEVATVSRGYKGSLYEQAVDLMSQYAKGFGPFAKYDDYE